MDLNKPGIYAIVNVKTKRMYIGKSNLLANRKYSHYSLLRSGKHWNKDLQVDFYKFGECKFQFQVLENTEHTDTLLEREQFFIDKYSAEHLLYNKKHTVLSIDKLCSNRAKSFFYKKLKSCTP